MPLAGKPAIDDKELNRNVLTAKKGPDPNKEDNVMLIRNRISEVYYDGKFFDYPISMNYDTIKKLGYLRTLKAVMSYIHAKMFPIKNEKSLEDFFINRFGKELYSTFFRDYTEKVWGTSCKEISSEWGAQRIKGLFVTKVIADAIKRNFRKKDLKQKKTETSLITTFYYPKYGPGQLWNRVADIIRQKGGEIKYLREVTSFETENNRIKNLTAINKKTGQKENYEGDYFLSSMPIKSWSMVSKKPQKM